ncbi:WxL domain-containing protein [Lacticaseibacillus kribbianus]|uniref:WxL domain-containing protein n=1 Tax=Lacticaseibacillus kribbianus TaxID=2926292 RepID=UPI001CD7E472|nr:WxL domain-containing protein [Lacticaseibacillus kribbianus]
MKKTLFMSAAALVLAASATVAPLAVSAAEENGPAVGTTTAEFTVNAGDGTNPDTNPGGDNGTGLNANLWLVKAPDLNFGTTNVAAIIKGTTLNYQNGDVKAKTNDPAENADGLLQVSDNRGIGAGWTLSASLSDLTTTSVDKTKLTDTTYRDQVSKSGDLLSGALKLQLTKPVSPNADLGQTAALSTDNQNVTIWTAGANQGQGDSTATVTNDTALTIDANAAVKAAQYDATITWTLSSTVTPN